MKLLIVEDELPARERIKSLILDLRPDVEIIGMTDSIESTVDFIHQSVKPDLAIFDIQLADGLSFDIFTRIELNCPVIFTTAFDEYALKAFSLNSVDYLLKPISKKDLERAFNKLNSFRQSPDIIAKIIATMQSSNNVKIRSRFLIKRGSEMYFVNTKDIAYMFSEDSMSFAVTRDRKKHLIDESIESIQLCLNPEEFYRINRKCIVRDESISKISSYFNSRLKLSLEPEAKFDVIVSREKVKEFKSWLDS